MKTFSELIKESKLDLDNLVFIPSGGSEGDIPNTKVKPQDFLKLAKSNLIQKNTIDAVSNAKRAIDCQIDEALIVLGIDIRKNKVLENFIKRFSMFNSLKEDIPFKLKIIQVFDYAPIFLVDEIRKIRHSLEHEYKLPSKINATRAVDVAELIIRSIHPEIKMLNNDFYITDKKNNGKGPDVSLGFTTGFSISFDCAKKNFDVVLVREEKQISRIVIKANSLEYYGLIRLMKCIEDPYEAKKSLGLVNILPFEYLF